MIFKTARNLIFIIAMLGVASVSAELPDGKITAAAICSDKKEISVHCGSVPSAVFNDGKLWVAFIQGDFVWLTNSSDAGKTFSKPVQVNNVAQEIYANGENRPKIHVRNNHVYVSWTEKTGGQYTGNIRFARSVDGGKSFSRAIKVNDDNFLTSHRFDAMHVTQNGRIYLVWLDKRDKETAEQKGADYSGSAVYFAVSDNHGKSFGKNKKIADHSCECCRIALDNAGDFAAQESEVAVLWRQIFSGGVRDHALMTLGAAGATSRLQRATVDGWKIDACPHHGPDIATDAAIGGYHMAWFSDGAKHQGLYYGLYNLDGAAAVTAMDASAGASHPQILNSKNKLLYAWKIFDGEKTAIKLKTSADHGARWSESRILAVTKGSSDYPLLIDAGNGRALLAWHTSEEGFRIVDTGGNAVPGSRSSVSKTMKDVPLSLQALTADSFKQIKKRYRDTAHVIVLWSATCAPCHGELEMLSQWWEENSEFPVVLIATDGIAESDAVADLLGGFKLTGADNWIFADTYIEKLRYSIDPDWRGELPRSYLVGPESTRVIKGLLAEDTLRDWAEVMR